MRGCFPQILPTCDWHEICAQHSLSLEQANQENIMRHTAEVDYSQVKKDLDALRNDVAQITSTLLREKQDVAKRFTENIVEGLVKEGHSIVDTAKSKGEQAVKTVTGTSHKAVERVEEKIQQRPFLSLALSFLSGLVIAELIERR